MSAGRPSKYNPTYCAKVITHMAEGASLTSFAAEIGVCRDTITEWTNVHPEFSLAVKRGKAKCAAWWERAQRKLAVSGEGNATACVFGLKNMAEDDWHDRKDVNLNHGLQDPLVSLLREIDGRSKGLPNG